MKAGTPKEYTERAVKVVTWCFLKSRDTREDEHSISDDVDQAGNVRIRQSCNKPARQSDGDHSVCRRRVKTGSPAGDSSSTAPSEPKASRTRVGGVCLERLPWRPHGHPCNEELRGINNKRLENPW